MEALEKTKLYALAWDGSNSEKVQEHVNVQRCSTMINVNSNNLYQIEQKGGAVIN